MRSAKSWGLNPWASPLGMIETSLRFRSSTWALAIRIGFRVGVLHLYGIGGFVAHDPGENASIDQRQNAGLVARGNLRGREENGGDQFVARVFCADARELGTDRSALLADGVALDAGQALQVAEESSAASGAPLPFQWRGRGRSRG